jgi:hypothetical protein
MGSVSDEPHPTAQRVEPNRATNTASTKFFTPTSRYLGFPGTAPLDSGGGLGKRLTYEKP